MTLREFLSMHPPLILDTNIADREISIIYYWYHHMMPPDMRNEIQRVIDEADYKAFKEWCGKLNQPDICYLPDTAYVYCGDDYIGDLPMGPQALYEITFSECECG
jgi:hypothetical protein